jgi:hypothetical protein
MFDHWNALLAWLKLPDADWLVDGIIDGSLPHYEAVQTLDDFSIPPTAANLKRLAHECETCVSHSWDRSIAA